MRKTPNPLSNRLLGLPKRPSLVRFLDYWLAHVAWVQLRYSTARTYSSVVVNLIGPTLGALRVSRLTTIDVEKGQLVWLRSGVTFWMRRKAIEVLRSALRHAVALGLCEVNPATRARLPPKRARPPTWLDRSDARRLLESTVGHPIEPAYALALGLGLRRGKMLGLTWNDLDLDRGVSHVRWNRTEFSQGTRLTAPKSAASLRTLALPAFVVSALRRHHQRELGKADVAGTRLKPSDPVMTTRTRRAYWTSYLHVELQARLRRLGLPKMRYHDLRHTAASLMLSERISPRTVMEILGHRNLAVTMFVCGHVNLRHQREAAEVVHQALGAGRRRRRRSL